MLSSDIHRVCTYWMPPVKDSCGLPDLEIKSAQSWAEGTHLEANSSQSCAQGTHLEAKSSQSWAQGTHLEAKVLFVGYSGVGKTCLVVRYAGNMFNKYMSPTIGASFFTCKMVFDNYRLTLQVWDTAGQERFRSMTPLYYRKGNAAMLVYDVTKEETFEDIKTWVNELKKNVDGRMVLCVLGNKIDLTAGRQVSREEAQEYASSIGAEHFETSALTNEGIQEAFSHVARELINLYEQGPESGLQVMDAGSEQLNTGTRLAPGGGTITGVSAMETSAPSTTRRCCS